MTKPTPPVISIPSSTGADDSPRTPKNSVRFVIKEGYAVAFGDVVLGKPLQEMAEGANATTKFDSPRMWSSAELKYYIRPNVSNPSRIEQAMQHLTQNSPLRFRPAENSNEDALVFEPSRDLCGSYMGRVGGPQPIFVADHCDWIDITHEILHALGFPHEHSRPDRDQYVQVLTENIAPQFLLQFEIMPGPLLDVLEATGFDYHSIMIYPQNAFAKDPNLQTLMSRNPEMQITPSREGLSAVDKDRLFRLYNNR